MADVEIVIAEDPVREVAERLAAAARAGGHVSLTGGSGVASAYELAAERERDWTRVELWWGDERCVAPQHKWSNYGLAKRALLERVELGAVHRMRGELGRDEGAARYDEAMQALEGFDLMLLGLGPDGHLASLYPNQPTLEVDDRRAIGAEAKLDPFVDRITMTLPMLRASDVVLFMVTGAGKADAARRAFAGEPSHDTPGSLVRGTQTIAVLDAAAASLL